MAKGWMILSHVEGTLEQGVMEESETQKYPLGFKLELADGRIFRYAKAGAVALGAGAMTGSPAVATERDASVNAASAVAIGATSFTVTAVGTLTRDQFAEGFAHIPLGTGLGLQYKIKGNTATAAGSECTITLWDPIVTALVSTTDVILSDNMWKNLIITPDDVIKATGVPTIPVTANYYFWSQTGGIATCLMSGTTGATTDERTLKLHTATDGALISATNTLCGTEAVGHHLFDSTNVADGEYWSVVLCIN